jgi:carboxyl-terminal processing protease
MNSRVKFLVVMTSACLVALLLLGAVLGKSTAPDNAYRHLAVFSEVLSRIKSEYVEEPDMKSVTVGALSGLLESIDPFASYLSADQYKEYLKKKDAHQAGVGLILSKKFGYMSVVDAIPGSPADKAGLTTGDIIEAIQGVATRDMPLAYADLLLRGDPGSTVELSVMRVRRPEPQKITLTRAVVTYPPVVTKMLADQTGYIEPGALSPARLSQVAAGLAQLRKQGAVRLILDLRHSAAGPPEDGVALANLFVDNGLLAYVQGQKSPRKDFNAEPSKAVWKLPVAVITNRGTAGGAEVAAAALLDTKRAQLVGERTYGDAAIRRAITMDDGAAIILSVAKYYSPSGKAIQDTGVTPQNVVAEAEPAIEFDEEGEPLKPETPEVKKPLEEDPLLKKALEVLGAAPAVQATLK